MAYLGPLPGMGWCKARQRYFPSGGSSSTSSAAGGDPAWGASGIATVCGLCKQVACLAAGDGISSRERSRSRPSRGRGRSATRASGRGLGTHHAETLRAAPADTKIIETLPLVPAREIHGSERECAICFELLLPADGDREQQAQRDDEEGGTRGSADQRVSGAQVQRLPCGHMYHRGCLKKWLESRGHCPQCRTPVDTALTAAAAAASSTIPHLS